MTGETSPAYVLEIPDTAEQIDVLYTQILPLVDDDSRDSAGNLIVMRTSDNRHMRLRDWLSEHFGEPNASSESRRKRVFAFLNS